MHDFLLEKINRQKESGLYRQLRSQTESPANLADFSSNDYLGLARSPDFYSYIQNLESIYQTYLQPGSGGSRLITGNHPLYEIAEEKAAKFFRAEAALIFNSGYDANLGLIPAVTSRNDLILYDEFCHASIRDGIRLSLAKSYSFRHNDLDDLRKKLNHFRQGQGHRPGRVFAVVESVYSMDGLQNPSPGKFWIREMADFCRENEIHLIVDEAHATGVFGKNGEGLAVHCQVEDGIFARVHTFGKAMGVHGACIVGSENLRHILINYARSFIYTTSLPPHSLLSIIAAFEYLNSNPFLITDLKKNIDRFATQYYREPWVNNSAIHYKIAPGNENARKLAKTCQDKGLDIRPILSPTVPAGKERLRICLHRFNKEEEIRALLDILL